MMLIVKGLFGGESVKELMPFFKAMLFWLPNMAELASNKQQPQGITAHLLNGTVTTLDLSAGLP